jgi:hypothetical protein
VRYSLRYRFNRKSENRTRADALVKNRPIFARVKTGRVSLLTSSRAVAKIQPLPPSRFVPPQPSRCGRLRYLRHFLST